jgi:large subunit ribosomal protein L11
MEFCNAFNEKTADAEPGILIPVIISVYSNKTFTFVTKTPPASTLLKKAAGIAKGSGEPNIEKVGKISQKQLKEIALAKEPDLNAIEIEAAMKIIAGTARSMGLEIEGQNDG